MKALFSAILAGYMLTLFTGCASMTIEETNDAKYAQGLRFYRPHPYLLVTRTDKGISAQIIQLPDKSREYVVKQNVGIGASDLSVTLQDGWNLTNLGHKLDTKVPETITALAGVAKLGLTSAASPGVSDVELYRINFSDGVVSGITKVAP